MEPPNQLAADIRLTSLPTALYLSRHGLVFVTLIYLVDFCSLIDDDNLQLDLGVVSIVVVAKSRAVTNWGRVTDADHQQQRVDHQEKVPFLLSRPALQEPSGEPSQKEGELVWRRSRLEEELG